MNTATVISAGRAQHPESGKDLMKVTVDRPYAVGGETYALTDVWGPSDLPEPQPGEVIQWGSSHIYFRGVRYDKPEMDSNPMAPLH